MNPSDPPHPTPIDDPGTFALRMEALVRLSTALTGLDDERRLFEVAKEYLDDVIPVGRASMGLVDDDGQVRVWGLRGSGVERVGVLLDTEGSAFDEVIRTGLTIYGPVAVESPWADFKMVASHGYGSVLVVPLLTGGATVGTLNVARVETHAFSRDDVRLLEHAGRFLAVSLLSIRRFAAATNAERASALAHELAAQRVRDIETINRVFRLLDDVNPIDHRLARAARELGGLRGVERCLLAVVGEDGELAPVLPPGGAQGRRREDDAGQPDRRRSERPPAGAVEPWTTLRRAVAERRPIWEGSTGLDGSWQAGHLAVPIVVRDRVAGALALVAQGGTLGASQGVLAETVAGQIANALERDLMFDELRRAAETADATSRARSQFLANMSHELRTPMNGVIGMTALLEGTELTPQQRGYVETIRISGEAQVAVINHILDFTKIEAARLELQISPFDLRTSVEDALDLAAATIGTKPVELSYDMVAELPDRYEGDGTRIRQVLINLVSNAVKFTERGEVTVRVAADGPGRLRITVADTGVGIPPDRIEWLFEPFTQLAAAPGQGQGGSGLGLAISRQLVELMGGTIGATSEPGRGSTFEVVIPLPAAADVQAGDSTYVYGDDAVGAGDDGLAGREALVVGLAPGSRAALVHTLEGWGMTARTGDDLASATDAGSPPDVALVDSRLWAAADGAGGWDRLADSLGIPVIPLCPVGLPPGAQPPGGPASVMARPLKPAALRAALRTALGLASPQERAQPGRTADGSPTGPVGADVAGEPLLGETHPLRVLVAEDNRVNQKVAVALLEHLGYSADVAADGLEAVAAATLGSGYDLVLMDLKMPGIDGIEAARRIRRLLPRHAPRIVAMTADTIAVVRSSCLNVGMAGFVPKPVRIENLAEVLRNTPPSAPIPNAIDEDALATLAGLVSHDPTAIDDIIGVWVADTPELVRDVQAAYQQGDLAAVVEAAHPLVSSSATVGALTLSSLAAAVEREARDGRMPTPVALAQLRLAADQAVSALIRRQRVASAG